METVYRILSHVSSMSSENEAYPARIYKILLPGRANSKTVRTVLVLTVDSRRKRRMSWDFQECPIGKAPWKPTGVALETTGCFGKYHGFPRGKPWPPTSFPMSTLGSSHGLPQVRVGSLVKLNGLPLGSHGMVPWRLPRVRVGHVMLEVPRGFP